MVFSLRIDIESKNGIKNGIPALLKLLRKHNLKASFYLTMGGESNLFELLRYRKGLNCERKLKIFSLAEKIRMAIFPNDFVKLNKNLLKKVIEEGHELGIHGWKHRAWSRGLNKINIRKHLKKSIKRYLNYFNKRPDSFCSPAFQTNTKVLEELERNKFKVISDFEGVYPSKKNNLINVPITIKGEYNTPIIEYLVTKGFSDEEILDYLKKEIKKKKLASLYIHDLYEPIYKINILTELFKFLNKENISVKTIKEIANEYSSNNK